MDRWVRFALDADAEPTTPDSAGLARYGLLDGDEIRGAERLGGSPTGVIHRLSEVRLLPPCSPTKIVCVGRNYVDHAKELNNPIPEEPLIFLKPPSSLSAHGDPIVLPKVSGLVHHEAELAVVIAKRARKVPQSEAWDYIWGYTCLNDVTARDIQKREGKFTRAKGCDTFCAIGPWVVPAAQVDLSHVRVRGLVDGEVRQDAPVSDLIFPLDRVIAFISLTMTLEPGDVIATGTPAGVGPLLAGNVVTVDIAGVGTLTNPVAAEA